MGSTLQVTCCSKERDELLNEDIITTGILEVQKPKNDSLVTNTQPTNNKRSNSSSCPPDTRHNASTNTLLQQPYVPNYY